MTNTQAWYSDRAFIAQLLTALAGVYIALRQIFPSWPMIETTPLVGAIMLILGAVGLFGQAAKPANTKVGLKTRRY